MNPEKLFQTAQELAFPKEIPGAFAQENRPLIQHRLNALNLAQQAFILHRGASAARLCGRIARSVNLHVLAECYFRAFHDLSGAAPDASFHLGQVLIEMGLPQEGLAYLKAGFAREPSQMAGAWRWAQLQAMPSDTDWEIELSVVDQLLNTGSGSYRDQTHLCFCRAYLLERLNRINEAMVEFTIANQRKPRPSDLGPIDAFQRNPIDVTKSSLENLYTHFDPAPRTRPIFIVGMPRSGTTLTERLLVEATGSFTAGELLDIDILAQRGTGNAGDSNTSRLDRNATEYLRSLSRLSNAADWVVDKMPTNFLHLHRIAQWFPDAIIVHCRRNERAVRWSCFTSNLAWPFCDLEACEQYQQAYTERMVQLRTASVVDWLDVDYEETVRSPDVTKSKLARFCEARGLDLLASPSELFATRTINRVSVHGPIHTGSVERWRKYEDLMPKSR